MRKTVAICAVLLILAAPGFSGVVKKTKSDITFRGFGKFSLAQSDKLTAEQRWSNMLSDFKGQGLAGGLAAKTILRSGDTGEIIDLPAATLYRLDNKKKEYTVSPIEKLKEMAGTGEEIKEEEEAEGKVKVTKNEFKVEDTGEESTINNFPVRKYLVLWLLEWEDVETGEKGASRLETLVWTTPLNDTLEKARDEEMKFAVAYLEKLGIEAGKMEEDVLGVRWMAILDSFGQMKGRPSRDYSKAASEMEKIKGYPVVIDGKYFISGEKPAGAAAEPEEEPSATDVKGRLGGLLKKTLKKKPVATESANEPVLAYRTEVLGISTPALGAADFQVPAGYKKKG
ncbi:MAG: hypothetical protein QHH14_08450 [Clostridiales bacterium]|nr:hypothetical protein [Clostridiales bacterium]